MKPIVSNNYAWLKKSIVFIKGINFPREKGVPLFKVIIELYHQIKKIGIAERASILTFNLMMAIPPSLMFIFSITPYLPFFSEKFNKEIIYVLKELSPDKITFQNLSLIINDLFYKPKNAVYSLSFFLFLFFASNASIVLMKTFNKSFEQTQKRHFFYTRLIALGLTLSLCLMFILLIILLNIQKNLVLTIIHSLHLTSVKEKNILAYGRIIFSSLFLYFTIAFIYRFTPAGNQKWKFFSSGATIASITMLLIILIFNFWTINFLKYNKTYGPLGTMIFVMSLIYFFSFILLIGFEINLCIDIVKQRLKAKGELKI